MSQTTELKENPFFASEEEKEDASRLIQSNLDWIKSVDPLLHVEAVIALRSFYTNNVTRI